MNRHIFEGKWEETKGRMKQLWGKFTDDDFKVIEGDHQEIYGSLKKYYGYTQDEAKKAVDSFLGKL